MIRYLRVDVLVPIRPKRSVFQDKVVKLLDSAPCFAHPVTAAPPVRAANNATRGGQDATAFEKQPFVGVSRPCQDVPLVGGAKLTLTSLLTDRSAVDTSITAVKVLKEAAKSLLVLTRCISICSAN